MPRRPWPRPVHPSPDTPPHKARARPEAPSGGGLPGLCGFVNTFAPEAALLRRGKLPQNAPCRMPLLGAPRPRLLVGTGGRARSRRTCQSDPRVNDRAGCLSKAKRFAEALADPAASGPGPSGPDRRAVSLGLAASRWSQESEARGGEAARAPGRGHRGVPVHPDP